MKVVIAGGRDFNHYILLKAKLLHYFRNYNLGDIEIVSGGARGADSLGERFAKEHGCKIVRFLPDWELFGKSAGYIRNAEMAKYADACVCFWDGKSKGTKHMINLAEKEGLKLRVVNYEPLEV
ncbi:DUF2493 family protein [Bacillus phage vB_BanS-Thrax1]|nr:DUF2493 family protein [Bacillus phage vB_BanS-Thrax1]